MSTKHTANIYVKNNTDGNAMITMNHQYSNSAPDTGSWSATPGQTVGPMTAHFETGIGTGFDYWWIKLIVQDGSTPGVYVSGGSIVNPDKKECMMESADANQNITNTVDTHNFNINLKSGGCGTGMTLVGPYAPITNVFVLMLENHSFDHMFGFSGISGINGLNGSETNSYNGNTYNTQTPAVDPMTTDPGHEFQDTLEQLCGQGTANPFPAGPYPPINNSGFVANYATSTTESTGLPSSSHFGDVLACTAYSQAPNLTWLAMNFVICDSWFASMPGPTWPNRLFAMGGSSAGLDDSPSTFQIGKWESVSGFTYQNGSIFDLLTNHGLQYRLYNDKNNVYAQNPSSLGGGIPIVSALKNINIWDVNAIENLANDLKGSYPYQFTFIEPNYGNVVNNSYSGGSSQHPMDSLQGGDTMVGAVYGAISNSPLWPTSMLIITYDEHGGFYDHVQPPPAVPPGDAQVGGLNTQGFDFSQYGVRVPAVIVSPLVQSGFVDNTLYDHTSILKTVEELFNLPSLTKRDAQANSLLHLLTQTTARTEGLALPESDKETVSPAAESRVAALANDTSDDNEPLPESGNLIGFLHAAMKSDIQMSGDDDAARQAIAAKVQEIQTKGEAKQYLQEVEAKAAAFKPAG